MRRLLVVWSFVVLLAPVPAEAAANLVIPAGQEEKIQAFLDPVGFSRPVTDDWILQNIAIDRDRVKLVFLNTGDMSAASDLAAAKTAELTIFHPAQRVRGTRMGPVVIVGDAPEEVKAALARALDAKNEDDLFWKLGSGTREPSALGRILSENSSQGPWFRLAIGAGAATLLAFLVWLEMRDRRKKKSVDTESTETEQLGATASEEALSEAEEGKGLATGRLLEPAANDKREVGS